MQWRPRALRVSTGSTSHPFLLQRLHLETGGRTLAAHRRLVGDNSELAGAIAKAYYAR